LILIIIFVVKVDSEENSDEPNKIIDYCSEQGYNITNPNDKFFNDICSVFYSKKKKDVSLEYRRKYYYYTNSNESTQILLNTTEINEEFPEYKRNNIFFCFKHNLSFWLIVYNISIYIIVLIFIVQMVSFIFLFIGDYENASKNDKLRYLNIVKNKKKKPKKVKQEKKVISVNNEENPIENNKTNGFSPLNEETKNNLDINKDLENGQIIEGKQIEFNETLNQNKTKNINDPNQEEPKLNNKSIKIIDDFTFGDKVVPKEITGTKDEIAHTKSDKSKEKDTRYIFTKMNSKPIKVNTKDKEKQLDLIADELFYSHFSSAALLQDKRSLKQIYFDILSHCQIICSFIQYSFIYEDLDVILLYYSIKVELYFLFNIIVLNSDSVINKLYDKKFTFTDCIIKCLIATILVNIISQILFTFTNSKRKFIKHINRLNNSLFNQTNLKNNLLNYTLREIILIINNNLYEKLMILCFINIIIFIFTFYCIICFCSTYFYTQFIVFQNIAISIFISQTSPFILAFIPAILRKKSLDKENEKLYYFSQYITSVFLP
jgi:hypothetical protein